MKAKIRSIANDSAKEQCDVSIPVFIRLEKRLCLLIGGGSVATRRAEWLLEAGAHMHVIAPEFCLRMRNLAAESDGLIKLNEKLFCIESDDIAEYDAVFVACGQAHINEWVSQRAAELGIPVNISDVPELCSFYVPATIRRGCVCMAIGTNGACPALAARLRDELALSLPDWLSSYAEALRRVRIWLMRNDQNHTHRRTLMKYLASREVAAEVALLDVDEMETWLRAEAERLM